MKKTMICAAVAAAIALAAPSCKKDDETIVITPPSSGKEQVLNGGTGGANAANSVFLDLSTDKQDSVARNAWDLRFYCGSDYRVTLNLTTAGTAKVLAKNDLTTVTAADTVGFAAAMALGQGAGTLDLIDDVDGDITKTVIAAVSATDADNKVYIVKPTNGSAAPAKDWYKVRILRNGSNYRLQYALIGESTFKTADISKDASYNFKFFNLATNSLVTVEPPKASWDIQWTLTTYKTAFGANTIPYVFSDYVYINSLGGTTAAEVLNTTVTYDNYAESNISTTTFSNSKVVIGGNWRATTGTVGVKTDRFYVIKDVAGNVYKLKFLSFAPADLGVRGYPKLVYKLVKQA
jgi:hypothetical protein